MAAGDVANYQDVLFGKRRRVEHWDNAVSQGQYCARVLMGERTPFQPRSVLFLRCLRSVLRISGAMHPGADEAIHRGDISSGSFSVWWLRGGLWWPRLS